MQWMHVALAAATVALTAAAVALAAAKPAVFAAAEPAATAHGVPPCPFR